ncbi:MAG: putative endonuclease [Patescibacteria group bacterium]|nr:putative endonuclease [Patescibacteria group bacterium]
MYYVYLLKSKKDDKFYTGCTNDLKRRIILHNEGKVLSTRDRNPLVLVYYEAFLNKEDAFQREQWLKTGWGRNHINKILSNYLSKI